MLPDGSCTAPAVLNWTLIYTYATYPTTTLIGLYRCNRLLLNKILMLQQATIKPKSSLLWLCRAQKTLKLWQYFKRASWYSRCKYKRSELLRKMLLLLKHSQTPVLRHKNLMQTMSFSIFWSPNGNSSPSALSAVLIWESIGNIWGKCVFCG